LDIYFGKSDIIFTILIIVQGHISKLNILHNHFKITQTSFDINIQKKLAMVYNFEIIVFVLYLSTTIKLYGQKLIYNILIQ